MTRRHTIWLAALVATLAVVLVGVMAVATLPELVRRAAVWRLASLTQRNVTIDRVDVNLFTGDLAVHGLQIDDRDEPGPLLRVERVAGRVHRRSLLELHVWIDELVIERSAVRIVRLATNRFNISDLLERPAPPPSRIGVTIDHMRVVDGTVVLEDRTLRPARSWRSERITIDARNISTARGDGTADGSTIVAGAPVHIRVDDLRLVPVHGRAHVTVGNVDLALLRLYLPGDAAVLPESGVLAAGITLVHDAHEGTTISAGARVHRLALERRGQSVPVATSPEVLITLNDLRLKGGEFGFARAEVEGDVDLTEAVVGPPQTYRLTGTRLVAEDLTWPTPRPGRLAFTSALPGGGTADVRGTVQLRPTRVDVQVKATGARLEHVNRYAALTGSLAGLADANARVVATWDRRLRLTVTGAVGANRVVVRDSRAPSAPAALSAERIEASGIDYEWPARIKLASLRVQRPVAVLERDAAGTLTLPELFRRQTLAGGAGEEAAAGITPDVTVDSLRVDGGTVSVVDNTTTPVARFEIGSVALTVRDLTWPSQRPPSVELAAGLPGGGVLSVTGGADLDRRRARARISLKNVDLAQAQPYLPFRGRVSGRADADLDARGRLDPLRLRVRGDVTVSEAGVEDLDRPLLAVERIALTGLDYTWPMRVSVEQVTVRSPWAKIDRNERGELTLRAAFLARRRPAADGATPGTATAARPEISVKRALVEEAASSVIDDSVEPAARFEVRGTRVEARNITYPVTIPAEVTLATPMPGGGRLEGRGTFQLEPARLELRAALSGVDLAPARPYLPVDARVSGTIDGDARLSATFEPFALTVRGNATVADLAVGDQNRSLLTAGRARAQGINVEWPGRVRVDAVQVDKPWLLLEREQSGRFPLVALLTPRSRAAPPRPAEEQRQPPAPPRVDIATVSVTDGFGRFVDRVTTPEYAEELSAVDLTVVGFGTAPGTMARTTLRGTVGPGAPLAISGEFTPPTGPRHLDILLTLGDYAAPRANAYLRTLFGWTAQQGKITLAAHYLVDGDALQATNDVGASGLKLARAPGDTPPRWPIGLPLDTFVALLKNREGDVELSVPVAGTLSSPKFDLGDAIASALRGIAVKTVTLPFSTIGRLFAGNDDARVESLQINPVLFEPGTTSLAAGMADHVDKLAAFLRERPGVRLELRPVLSVEDVTRLKRQVLRERVAAQAGERTRTAMRDALAKLYAEQFPRRGEAPVDEMVAALAENDPAPTAATAALATRRVEAVREALTGRGVEAARLPALDATAAVEASGTGRVEFELVE